MQIHTRFFVYNSPFSVKHTMEIKLSGRKRSGTIQMGDEKEPFFLPAMKTAIIEDGFFQHYTAAVLALFKLKGCAKDLILFMATTMDKDNLVDMPLFRKQQFVDLAKSEEGTQLYNVRTVDNALSILKKKQFIDSVGPASFKVNPVLFYKGGKERRARAISLHLEFYSDSNVVRIETELLDLKPKEK